MSERIFTLTWAVTHRDEIWLKRQPSQPRDSFLGSAKQFPASAHTLVNFTPEDWLETTLMNMIIRGESWKGKPVELGNWHVVFFIFNGPLYNSLNLWVHLVCLETTRRISSVPQVLMMTAHFYFTCCWIAVDTVSGPIWFPIDCSHYPFDALHSTSWKCFPFQKLFHAQSYVTHAKRGQFGKTFVSLGGHDTRLCWEVTMWLVEFLPNCKVL